MNFGAKSTAEEVSDYFKDNIKERSFLITGGGSGLGLETARALAAQGGLVTIACRDLEQTAAAAVAEIKQQHQHANIDSIQLDLSSLTDVKRCADELLASGRPLDVLINNAGVKPQKRVLTSDGLELNFQINFLAPLLLTRLLLPRLSRVVNVSSNGHVAAPPTGLRFDDLAAEKHFSSEERYGASKLAMMLMTTHMQKNNKTNTNNNNHNVLFLSLHPGMIFETRIHLSDTEDTQRAWAEIFKTAPINSSRLQAPKSVQQGAATTVFCAAAPAATLVPGGYYADCAPAPTDEVHPLAWDENLEKRLATEAESIIDQIMSKK